MMLLRTAITCCTLVTVAWAASFDDCDWTGSGSVEMFAVRGVQPVYLRCHRGTVRWNRPLGALRIVLQSPGEFCIRRSSASSGARIYLATKKKLRPVFRTRDAQDLVRCVKGSPVALYVEADPLGDALQPETMEFSYHLKKRSNGEECEPCTEEQLLRHYCTSDFVIQGTVSDLYHNKELQTSELTVRVDRLHRTNELNEFASPPRSTNSEHVILQRPLHCGTKPGTGQYLFLGKWELGNAVLHCVPRMSEWKRARRKALQKGTNECLLQL